MQGLARPLRAAPPYLHEANRGGQPRAGPYYQQQQAAAGQYAGGAAAAELASRLDARDDPSGAVCYRQLATGRRWPPQVPPPPPPQQQQQLVPPAAARPGMPQAPAAAAREAAEPRARGPPQLLLGDVGGTNLRLVPLWELRAATLPEPTHRARYRTADLQLREALARFGGETGGRQIVACTLSVCG